MSTLKQAIAKMKGQGLDFTPEKLRDFFVAIAQEIILDKFSEIEKEIVNTIEKRIEPMLLKKVKGEPGPMGLPGRSIKGEKGDKGDSIAGPTGPKGRDYILTQKDRREIADLIPMPEDGKDGSPDTPDQVIDKINSADRKIKKTAIDGLTEELRNILLSAKQKSAIIRGGGDILQYYDISNSLNGVSKTFTIPIHRKIILVVSSSTPFIFRPTTDYTASGTLLSFDAAIDAESMLAAGQSIIVVYTQR